MANELLIPNVGGVQPQREQRSEALRTPADSEAFAKELKGKLAGQPTSAPSQAASATPLRFSAHALNRIKDRSIAMNDKLMSKLEKAVDTAAQKGARESLILSDDAAFIVSIKNKTVITVLDRSQMNGNVFTNIDSTVVI